jgi:hypothetical protein
MSNNKNILFDKALKAFAINGPSDTTTVITKQHAADSRAIIMAMRNEIIANYPVDFSRKIRLDKEFSDKDLITILRQICRYHKRRLASNRKYIWNKSLKKQECISQYNLL